MTNRVRFVGTVNPEERVLPTLVEIKRTRAQRIGRASFHSTCPFPVSIGLAADHVRRRCPVRPGRFTPDPGFSGELQPFLPDSHAISQRLAILHYEIQKAIARIDDDGTWRFIPVVVDELTNVFRAQVSRIDGRDVEFLIRRFAVTSRNIGRDGGRRNHRWLRRCHASRQQSQQRHRGGNAAPLPVHAGHF